MSTDFNPHEVLKCLDLLLASTPKSEPKQPDWEPHRSMASNSLRIPEEELPPYCRVRPTVTIQPTPPKKDDTGGLDHIASPAIAPIPARVLQHPAPRGLVPIHPEPLLIQPPLPPGTTCAPSSPHDLMSILLADRLPKAYPTPAAVSQSANAETEHFWNIPPKESRKREMDHGQVALTSTGIAVPGSILSTASDGFQRPISLFQRLVSEYPPVISTPEIAFPSAPVSIDGFLVPQYPPPKKVRVEAVGSGSDILTPAIDTFIWLHALTPQDTMMHLNNLLYQNNTLPVINDTPIVGFSLNDILALMSQDPPKI